MKRLTMFLVALALVAAAPVVQAEEMSWTGEVLDLACYVAKGAHGADHAGCAKACVKGGQPMGLLTEDGTVVLLAANHDDGAPYEALKDWAGSTVVVTGELVERDGMKLVSVTGSKAAS
ncbi:MAG: hypothetical protein R3244_09215 [Thermoanaerobaculia bacterium]|nr:hypothetical protein [Thermoanaerobaculia bacterium]